MSSPTVFYGNWNAEYRAHPAMAWMEKYTKEVIDAHAWSLPALKYHHPDFTLQKADGTVVTGASPAWAALAAIYAPLTATLHEPVIAFVSEVPGGWQMLGVANLYANLPGSEGGQFKDESGKAWELKVPSGFWFEYLRTEGAEGGISLGKTRIYANEGVIMMAMMQKGMIKASDLGL